MLKSGWGHLLLQKSEDKIMKKFNKYTAVLLAGLTAASLTGGAVSVFADSDVTVVK